MPNFIIDNTAISDAMNDRNPRPSSIPDEQWWGATRANEFRSALIDVQGFLNGTSIAIASEAAGDFDFGTLGAFDWTFSEAWGVGKHLYHGKAAGGWLLESFAFLMTEGASAVDTRGWLNLAQKSDDVDTNGLINVDGIHGVTKNLNGYNGTPGAQRTGFRFRLPCSQTARTVRWQGTAFNALTTVTAKIAAPGGVTTQTRSFDTTAGNGLDYRAAVTFSGPPGSFLVVTHVLTTLIGGGSGNLYVGPIGCA